ncbi:hypothetical protein ACTXT7_001046 [Hymenolepis weldensis]
MSPVDLSLEISLENQLFSNTFEIGYHNESDITSLHFEIESPRPTCVSVHFTSIYNVPEPKKMYVIFAMDITVNQDGSSATAFCTPAHFYLSSSNKTKWNKYASSDHSTTHWMDCNNG